VGTTFVAFDTETATFQGAPHLLELGAVRFREGESLEHFERLVRPEVPIAPEASDFHGLADEDVAGADGAAEVLEAFRAFAGDAPLFAHNARADAWVLAFECARYDVAPADGPVLDSLALARACLADAPDHKLDTLVEHLEIECDVRHRALPDAVACWQVVEACVQELGGWSSVSAEALAARAGGGRPIADAAPRRPRRRPSVVRALEGARSSGECVRLHYGEGDGTPPAALPVRPRLVYQVKDRGYLEGECVRSGTLKTYRIDRIHRVELLSR